MGRGEGLEAGAEHFAGLLAQPVAPRREPRREQPRGAGEGDEEDGGREPVAEGAGEVRGAAEAQSEGGAGRLGLDDELAGPRPAGIAGPVPGRPAWERKEPAACRGPAPKGRCVVPRGGRAGLSPAPVIAPATPTAGPFAGGAWGTAADPARLAFIHRARVAAYILEQGVQELEYPLTLPCYNLY